MTELRPQTPPPASTEPYTPTPLSSPPPHTSTPGPSLPNGSSAIRAHPSNPSDTPDYYETQMGSAPIPVNPNAPPITVNEQEEKHFLGHLQSPLRRTSSHENSQFLTSVPLASLTRGAAPVDCPLCGRRAMTDVSVESGNFTHLWAALTCATCCLGCVPYFLTNLKDVKHSCGNCGALLAIWHRSGGGVDVMAHPMKDV